VARARVKRRAETTAAVAVLAASGGQALRAAAADRQAVGDPVATPELRVRTRAVEVEEREQQEVPELQQERAERAACSRRT
jgi:hypothetical protein